MTEAGSTSTQVLVIGAGPAGLVAAITLARYGISLQVVEKRDTISTLSRALVISTRSMEILRSWGLEDEVRAGAADVEPYGWLTPTLASGEGAIVPLGYPTQAEAAAVSPTWPAWTPQDQLEPILVAHLRGIPGAEIHFGSELVAIEQDDENVRARVRDRASGKSRVIDALYIIGADGAPSRVRDQLGIQMDGQDDLGDYERVEFRAALAAVAGERRYGLTIITHPDAGGVLAPRGRYDRWGLSRESGPGQSRLADYSKAELIRLIRAATGLPDLLPLVERCSSFSFAAQIAQRYRDRRGFLVGDAAHRMTPRGGTGMNTAIQDAYDLAWKLAWVLRGWAETRLLDSYEHERRPVGLHNVERSGNPDGARSEATEALAWDLNGRIAHHWLGREGSMRSTLDLLGDGLTLLAGPAEPRWAQAAAVLPLSAPTATHTLDAPAAHALGIPVGGAVLLRPDGKRLHHWPGFTTSLDLDPLPGILA